MSALGLGAILYQEWDGVKKVISYASQSLSKSEAKYHVHKLEFLCLKWAITDQFPEYLYENTFDVYMDNNPLTYVLTTVKLDAMGHRWIAGLANYNFHIHYKSGKSNMEADALSMIDWEKCDEIIPTNSIQEIFSAATAGNVANHIEAVPSSPQTIDSMLPSIPDTPIISKAIKQMSRQSHPTHPESESSVLKMVSNMDDFSCPEIAIDWQLNLKCMTEVDWVEVQSNNKTTDEIIWLFKAKQLWCWKGKETDSYEMRQFIRQWNRLLMRNGIQYHKNEIQEVNHTDRNTM